MECMVPKELFSATLTLLYLVNDIDTQDISSQCIDIQRKKFL